MEIMSYQDYITNDAKCQDCGKILSDKTAGGRERPWVVNKKQSQKVAELYRYVDNDKAERILACAEWLQFRQEENGFKLQRANFCRVRLCPMCQWRRSLKVYSQMTRICDNIDWTRYQPLFLTLTVQNCAPEKLSETLDTITDGFTRLIQYKDVQAAVKGAYRAIEITVNNDPKDEWCGTLHPHIHALLIVNKSYFKDRTYISHEEWVQLWQRACKLDYAPMVNVKRVKMTDGKDITDAIREVAKYTLKSEDITNTTLDPVQLLDILDRTLNNRRFIGLSGMLKELHKKLNLSDAEDDKDLVNVGEDPIPLDDARKQDIYYIWRSGVYIEWDPTE